MLGIGMTVAILGPGAAGAVYDPDRPAPEGPAYVAGRLIVKLTPAAAEQVAPIAVPITAARLPITALRALSRRYKVSAWRPLFPHTIQGQSPAGTVPGAGLDRVYVLTCDRSVDISAAVQAFAALTEYVEYAEPDHVVRIQEKVVDQ